MSHTCCVSLATGFTSRTRSHITHLISKKRYAQQRTASLSPSRLAILSLTTESESPQRRWYTTSEEQTQLESRRSQTLPFCCCRERGEFECCIHICLVIFHFVTLCYVFCCLRSLLDLQRCWSSCLYFARGGVEIRDTLPVDYTFYMQR